MKEMEIVKKVFLGFCTVAFAIVACILAGYIVMYLWNWLIPGIFGWTSIGFKQAVGLVILSRILFGNFGGHKKCCCGSKGFNLNNEDNWKRKMKAKFSMMSPEEKSKFKGSWGKWCCSEDENYCAEEVTEKVEKEEESSI